MAHWIAILVALVCLSGSSLSRSWVGFDNTDDFESWQADVNDYDYGPNRKSKFYRGEDSWESDEDSKDSGYEHGYGHDKPIFSNNEYYKDHGSHHGYGYHDHRQGCDHLHHYHGFNGNWGHHGHHTQTGYHYQPNQHWGHHYHSPSSGQSSQNSGSQGHHDQSGFTGQPGQNWGSPGYPGLHWAHHGHNTQTPNLGQPGQSTETSRGLPQNNVNRPQGSAKDADRIVFPDFNNQDSTTRPPATDRPTTTTIRTTTSTTTRTTTTDRTLLDVVICMRACPTTSEYNPVCGTNNVTYNNPGALQCARNCGVSVSVARQAPCPRPVPQPTTAARPIANPSTARSTPRPSQTTMRAVTPTRFTNINVNLVNKPGFSTIPIEILQSVFGTASPTISNTEESEYDIDKRGNLD